MLAAALPHLLYSATCAAVSRIAVRLGLGPRYLASLLAIKPTVSTGLPALHSMIALGRSEDDQKLCLRYWVVWAFVQLKRRVALLSAFRLAHLGHGISPCQEVAGARRGPCFMGTCGCSFLAFMAPQWHMA